MLENIASPSDVKALSDEEKLNLCEEIRNEIIKTVAHNGGHLASNLGVVELTVALFSVFDLDKDTIVWDVGHQIYAHKLLTGRYKDFSGLRTMGGLSGFRIVTKVLTITLQRDILPLRFLLLWAQTGAECFKERKATR